MCIGSTTSQSVFKWGSNKLSVAKKLSARGEAQAELAIRYWVSNNCLQGLHIVSGYPMFVLSTSMGHQTLFDRDVAAKAQPSLHSLLSEAVYTKVAVDWRHFSSIIHYRQPSTFMYIGSTSQSVFRWESNRLSVAKKLSAGGEAQAELAIRYWVSNNCLQDYTLFLVTLCLSYRQAWVTEHCLIGMWQPKLNHPYIVFFVQVGMGDIVQSHMLQSSPV